MSNSVFYIYIYIYIYIHIYIYIYKKDNELAAIEDFIDLN